MSEVETHTDKDDEQNDFEFETNTETAVDDEDLTKFQTHLLLIIRGYMNGRYQGDAPDGAKGLAIKTVLETSEFHGEEVNHGRLYPNLDDLVEKGLVAKSELDKRTNEYVLTDAGVDVLRARLERDIAVFNGEPKGEGGDE